MRQLTDTAAIGFSGAMAGFTAAVGNYDRFMGRYATGLAAKFVDAAGVRAGMRVLDVGCGPDALAGRVGEGNVAAIDPAPQFAAACRARIPGADVREGVAESLPWDDGTFDASPHGLIAFAALQQNGPSCKRGASVLGNMAVGAESGVWLPLVATIRSAPPSYVFGWSRFAHGARLRQATAVRREENPVARSAALLRTPE
jgi:SAM-dependent methyltransferase